MALATATPLPAKTAELIDSARPVSYRPGEQPNSSAVLDGHLQLVPELGELLPGGVLKRGGCVGVAGRSGRTSLLLRLLAGPMAAGSWAAVIGIPELSALAAAELGVTLDHLALVPDPGTPWLDVTAALLDCLDIVVLSPPKRCRPTDARRLLARARQRQSVLIIVDGWTSTAMSPGTSPTACWPESPDLTVEATEVDWQGLRVGHGSLRHRCITVATAGRRLNGPRRVGQLRAGR
ncbi:MAG: hypothetical protein WBB44_02615 [Candidatus Nanopelagicales bacterium]|nr:hypothetical protein [Candidatus Nanopelagicales bacterium]